MSNIWFLGVCVVLTLAISCVALAQERPRDLTCFQTGSSYAPEIDTASDVAVVYGSGPDFADRAARWREKGYALGMMTGIAWGGYDAYFGTGDAFKKDEIQTVKSGRLLMHGDSTACGYNVPTDSYIEFLEKYIEPAVDAGVQAIYLEEPEFWAEAGWSEAFKREWAKFYGEPWRPPDSSVDAQYRASKLKYEMYFNALRGVFAHAKKRVAEKGRTLECHVPTHSLINYAQWRIVSPESHLVDIPELDGYIAQVWTGTARSANIYRGVTKERTFETAYLEYGQAFGMVRPTGKKVWFLADPVEDNPNHSWNDYKLNYECTLIASLMWPGVCRYETMPWPDRIFRGAYPKLDMDTKSGQREGIPAAYATEILAIINALNEMDQGDVVYDTGSRGVGLVVSDTLMFQRAEPQPSDPYLGCFYGLALPLVKNGLPLEIIQLENAPHPECLKSCKVLLLTYEGQKPLKPEYHQALERWVRDGGGLIYVGDDSDPYNGVREWWNDQGKTPAKPSEDLFKRLAVSEKARSEPERCGAGYVRILRENPAEAQKQNDGARKVIGVVAEMFKALGQEFKIQNYLRVRRGPFVVVSVLDESVSEDPLRLRGVFVDLFDPALPIIAEKDLKPGQRALLYDLDWARKNGPKAKVLAAAARVKNETLSGDAFSFVTRGPKASRANARILLPKEPATVSATPPTEIQRAWDAATSTLWVSFDNNAEDVTIHMTW